MLSTSYTIDLIQDLLEKARELVFGHLDGEFGSSLLEVLFHYFKDGLAICWREHLKEDTLKVW